MNGFTDSPIKISEEDSFQVHNHHKKNDKMMKNVLYLARSEVWV